ncbi:hypothetical protein AHAS_Ahas19G0015200 [Arachis hypogaea]
MKLCNPATKPCPTMTLARFFHSSHLHIHGGFTSVLLAIPPFSRNSLTSLDRVYFCTNWSLPPLCVVSKIGFSAVKDEVASPGNIEFETPLKIVEYSDLKLRAK